MKTLYLDLIGGISGDMTVAALLDFGVDFSYLKHELAKIRLKRYVLKKSRVSRGHVTATKFDVLVDERKKYTYPQIKSLIRSSRLSKKIKENILKVYQRLADAEAKVHGHRHRNIPFEQIGEIDSVVDIAALCIGLDKLQAEDIYYSVIPVSNKIAPATFKLLGGQQIYFTDYLYENVTPTGMAILSALAKQADFSSKVSFVAGRCGYGAGALDSLENPNVVRVVELKEPDATFESDEIHVIEANIDDMNPQFFEYVFEKLFQAGALDVFIENIHMKKTRPGFLLTVLSNPKNLDKISRLVLKETTTSGIRFYPAKRLKLAREIRDIDFRGQKARVKVVHLPHGDSRVAPEYEDCRRLAQKTKISISKIYHILKQKAGLKWHSQD